MQAGETIGRYKIVKHLASGGMAEVFLAQLSGPVGFEKLFVIKQVLRSLAEREDVIRMFLDEGRLAARLSHPNIGQIYELGESEDGYFLAMEYVSGENLSAVRRAAARAGQGVPPFFIARVATQILDALSYAHGFKDPARGIDGIVHRDVTPHNILISYDGHVKLVDFGIAKAAGRTTTGVGRLKGKFGYLSPEALRQEALDGRADLFSLGAAMYELIAGVHPFDADNPAETLMRIAGGDFKPLDQVAPGCPAGIVVTVHRALAARVEDRYQSARQMLEALDTAIEAERLGTTSNGMAEYMGLLFEPRLRRARSQVVDGLEPTVEVALASLKLADEDEPALGAFSRVPALSKEVPRVPTEALPSQQIVTAPVTESLIDIPAPSGPSPTIEVTKADEATEAVQMDLVSGPFGPPIQSTEDKPPVLAWVREPRFALALAGAFLAGALVATGVNFAFFRRPQHSPEGEAGTPSPVAAVTEHDDGESTNARGSEGPTELSLREVNLAEPGQKQGVLIVRTDARAAVFVDGKRVGSGTFKGTLAAGEHWVEARSPRERKRLRVEIVADKTRDITLPIRRR